MKKHNPAFPEISSEVNHEGVSKQKQFQTAQQTCYGVRLSSSFGENWVQRANKQPRVVTRRRLY